MTTILALDTATAACSCALRCGEQQFSTFKLEPQSHTKLILPMIDSLLTQAGVTLNDIDVITFTHGPGSFTGIRIGFGVVQGLALGADLPVIPVSTLKLMAATAARKYTLESQQVIVPIIDARMNELYQGQYQWDGNLVNAVVDDCLIAPEHAFNSLSTNTEIFAVGDGWAMLEPDKHAIKEVITDFYPEAQDLLNIASAEFEAGLRVSIKGLEPLYLRDRITWKKRQRLRQ